MDSVEVFLIMLVFLFEFLLKLLDHLVTRFDSILALFVELFQLILILLVEVSLFLFGEGVDRSSIEPIKWILDVVIRSSGF